MHVQRLRKKLPTLADALSTDDQFGYKLVEDTAAGSEQPDTRRMRFRTRLFLATFLIAAVVLLVASVVIATLLRRQTYAENERGLVAQTRLAAELLTRAVPPAGNPAIPVPGHGGSPAALQSEANALARDTGARVTLIGPDGQVIGDSSQDEARVAELENHGSRPEVVQARERGIGVSSRYSATGHMNMLYVAVPTRHPAVAIVRLALPLREIDAQLATIWRTGLPAGRRRVRHGVGLFAAARAALEPAGGGGSRVCGGRDDDPADSRRQG